MDYLNVMGLADTLSTRIRYDVMRRNTYYNVNYRILMRDSQLPLILPPSISP